MENGTSEYLLAYRLKVQDAVQRGLDLLSRERADAGVFVRGYQSRENWGEVFKQAPISLFSNLPLAVVTFDEEPEGVVRLSALFSGHGTQYHLHLPLESLKETDPSLIAGFMLGAWILHRLGPTLPALPELQDPQAG